MRKLLFAIVAWLCVSPTLAQGLPNGGGPQMPNIVGCPLSGCSLPSTTVAGLPACNSTTANAMRAVSDATTPAYNGALTGGGAVKIPVYCNGSAWTAH